MNKKLRALYSLKYNPFSADVPTSALLRVTTINDGVVFTVNGGNRCWIGHGGMDSSLESGDAVPHTPWDFPGIRKKRPLGVHVNRGNVSRFHFHRAL